MLASAVNSTKFMLVGGADLVGVGVLESGTKDGCFNSRREDLCQISKFETAR